MFGRRAAHLCSWALVCARSLKPWLSPVLPGVPAVWEVPASIGTPAGTRLCQKHQLHHAAACIAVQCAPVSAVVKARACLISAAVVSVAGEDELPLG